MNKPIKWCASEGWNDAFGGLEAALYRGIAAKILEKHPVDMLVFECYETVDNRVVQKVRLAGYYLEGPNKGELEEKKTVWKEESLLTDTFWLKLDDYGDYYVVTFLFPHEY